MEEYAEKVSNNMFYQESIERYGVPQIRADVEQHINKTGKKPVVFVDYLQILAPANPRYSDKQNTDEAILGLKKLSRDYKIPVVVISSFNRSNYNKENEFESFKESGGIEYSADVLIGLQHKGVGKEGVNLREARRENPRSSLSYKMSLAFFFREKVFLYKMVG